MRSGRILLGTPTGGRRLIPRELSGFGLVGGVCFVLDLLLFQLLYAAAGVPPVAAKALSALVTTSVAFLGHRFLTYGRPPRTSVRRGYVRFGAVNATTLLLGLGIIGFVRYGLDQEDALVLQLANVASIAVGASVRFVVYRRWVFPQEARAS